MLANYTANLTSFLTVRVSQGLGFGIQGVQQRRRPTLAPSVRCLDTTTAAAAAKAWMAPTPSNTVRIDVPCLQHASAAITGLSDLLNVHGQFAVPEGTSMQSYFE